MISTTPHAGVYRLGERRVAWSYSPVSGAVVVCAFGREGSMRSFQPRVLGRVVPDSACAGRFCALQGSGRSGGLLSVEEGVCWLVESALARAGAEPECAGASQRRGQTMAAVQLLVRGAHMYSTLWGEVRVCWALGGDGRIHLQSYTRPGEREVGVLRCVGVVEAGAGHFVAVAGDGEVIPARFASAAEAGAYLAGRAVRPRSAHVLAA